VPFGPAVHAPPDTSAAQWIAPELGDFGTVGGLVPHGYERYLLLDYRGAEPLGWSGVCGLFGRLVPILAAHTSTPDDCWFALWEGYGFDTSTTLIAAPRRDGRTVVSSSVNVNAFGRTIFDGTRPSGPA